jgi:hypothetical protein
MTRRRRYRSGRAPLFSPGRPVVAARDEQRRFWAAVAAGVASEDAALQAGMSQAVGTRLPATILDRGGDEPASAHRRGRPASSGCARPDHFAAGLCIEDKSPARELDPRRPRFRLKPRRTSRTVTPSLP